VSGKRLLIRATWWNAQFDLGAGKVDKAFQNVIFEVELIKQALIYRKYND
jgi:hypothetical protein